MRGEFEGDRLRQRHVTHLPSLGKGEELTASQQLDLPADVHDPAQEVDVIDRQPVTEGRENAEVDLAGMETLVLSLA